MTLVFLDTATTSLRHDRRAWEVALIRRDDQGEETREQWFIAGSDLDLGNADLGSLKIGRFYERYPGTEPRRSEPEIMAEVERLTRGATIVGAVPWFNTEVLGNRMRAHGILPSWHYHLIDVETLAAGAERMPPPWDFDTLLAAYGLTYEEADRHTAMGDAELAMRLYDAALAGKE